MNRSVSKVCSNAVATITCVFGAAVFGIAFGQDKKPVAAAAALSVPQTWSEFKASKNAQDVAAVSAVEKAGWPYVCRDWGNDLRAKSQARIAQARREYLLDQDIVNGLDLMYARERRVEVGMTTCGVFAAIGQPDAVNYTKTAGRLSAQVVYRARRMYVYTEATPGDHNGIVRSVQY